jgi:internalin A
MVACGHDHQRQGHMTMADGPSTLSLGDLERARQGPVLDLSGRGLTSLPPEIGRLTNLQTLNLSGNGLTSLPPEIGRLTNLRTLYLDGNGLTSLPPEIVQLTNLRTLYLSGNRLTSLPATLAPLLRSGLVLRLLGNPLADPLPELFERGTDALAAYLSSIGDAVVQYEAKLLLVGEGNVGKTSLVAALCDKPFVEGRPTTHGIEIHPLALHHPRVDVDMTLRAWDFGGQEVYRITHQFFFSRRALYLLVWNAREGQERNEVEGWLRRIRLRVGDQARVIVVATHADERFPELDYPHLEQVLPGMLAGQYAVDNKSSTGVGDLRRAIADEAARLPHMGGLLSHRWVAARDETLALADQEPQVSYERFAGIAQRHGLTGDEAKALLGLLHDLGQVVYYGDDDGLRDVVVLNPEWLTKAIGYVLEDRPTRAALGVLDHTRLKAIWRDRPDGPGYPERYHPYFLRLMEKFDVCYRLDRPADASLVAQLVPHELPDLPWDTDTPVPDGTRQVSLLCTLSESAPGLMAWLTVRHHDASTERHWRSGVFLRHPIAAYASEALLRMSPDGTRLHIQVRASSPDLFFNVLRESVEHLIRNRWPGLTYKLSVPCSGTGPDGTACGNSFPLHGLLQYREDGGTTHRCLHCRANHDVSQLLTGFAVPATELRPDLDRLHDQISEVADNVSRVGHLAADTAAAIRRVTNAIAAEVTDCPRLFTIEPVRRSGLGWVRLHQRPYRLTLWCEHPGYWHPWPKATYDLHQPKTWFAEIAPYVAIVSKTLRLAVPTGAAILGVGLSADHLDRVSGQLDLMKTVFYKVPENAEHDGGMAESTGTTAGLTPVQGKALRGFRAFLLQQDTARAFGDLRRVHAPSGEVLWVCPEHHPIYDPGLPTIPE